VGNYTFGIVSSGLTVISNFIKIRQDYRHHHPGMRFFMGSVQRHKIDAQVYKFGKYPEQKSWTDVNALTRVS
jgi:hypothetical protein